jgi:hypothetical protein
LTSLAVQTPLTASSPAGQAVIQLFLSEANKVVLSQTEQVVVDAQVVQFVILQVVCKILLLLLAVVLVVLVVVVVVVFVLLVVVYSPPTNEPEPGQALVPPVHKVLLHGLATEIAKPVHADFDCSAVSSYLKVIYVMQGLPPLSNCVQLV